MTRTLLLSLLLLPGCVRSLHPIYTDETVVYDPAFLGTWVDSKGETRIEVSPWSGNDEPTATKTYLVVHTDKDGKRATLGAVLAKVGDMLVADLTIGEEGLPENDLYKAHVMPLHTFWIVSRGPDDDKPAGKPTMSIRTIDHEWMKTFLESKPNDLAHYKSDSDMLLTATPPELQKFLIAHAADEGMLSDAEVFRRIKPFAAPATAPTAPNPAPPTTAPTVPTSPPATGK